MSNSDFAAFAAAVTKELADYDHLPALAHVAVFATGGIHISVDGKYRTFEEAKKIARWAQAVGTMVSIEAQWVTTGRVSTIIPFKSGEAVLAASMSTAMAYELGRRLQIPLPERGSIEVTAEQLLTALAADTETAVA